MSKVDETIIKADEITTTVSKCYLNQVEWKYEVNETPLLELEYPNKIKKEKYKSIMYVGNLKIRNIKQFNILNKFLWKLLLGIKIIDIIESEEKQ